MEINAIPRRLAFTAGGQQLINWGISFYMPGTFAGAIAADKGWSLPQIYLGLTLAMLMMAAVSPFVARLLARFGGRLVVTSGTLLIAASCAMMAWRPSLAGWYGAWLLTGIGMRLSLYDALFAAVVNLYGQPGAENYLSYHSRWRSGLCPLLAAGRGVINHHALAECPADLCAVWPG